MEKRTMLALFITMILLVLFQYFYAPKQQPPAQENPAPAIEEAVPATVPAALPSDETDRREAAESLLNEEFAEVPAEVKTYSTEKYTLTLSTRGGTITSWVFDKYDVSILGGDSFILARDSASDVGLPYTYEPRDNGFAFVYDDGRWRSEKVFSFDRENPYILHFHWKGNILFDKILIRKAVDRNVAERAYGKPLYFGDKLRYVKVREGTPEHVLSSRWGGFNTKYFLGVFLAEEAPLSLTFSQKEDENGLEVALDWNGKDPVTFFYGPKRTDILSQIDPELEKSIQFGSIIRPISMVFLWALKGIYGWIGNYGIAIIILTILVKLIFFPLTHKSYISMAKMQKIQPEVQKIQKKYKDNPQEMNKRVMEIYQKNKVNPMGGCLPLLLQFPVLWALFRVFSNAIELKGQSFFLWINDLSMPDTLFKLPFALPFLGSNFNVLPILMFVSMIWMQKMTPAQGNVQGANKFMMQVFMPVFMLIIFYSLPSGLVLYFLLSNVISIGQQKYTRNHLKAQEA